MSSVLLEGLRKSFGDVLVVKDFHLHVAEREFVSLLGASGCGKTTVLRLIAGLEEPDAGRITVGERVVCDAATGAWIPPERRHIGMVFQSYAVWPHMTVFENAAYPLRVLKVPATERRARTLEILELVGLAGLEKRRPAQLSGGQQQRVALARGLVMRPEVLLLDEPLSNLDAKLRVRMRRDIRRIQQVTGFTVVYVTHDQEEAMEISDRIVIMDDGAIVEQGTPEAVKGHAFLVPLAAEEDDAG